MKERFTQTMSELSFPIRGMFSQKLRREWLVKNSENADSTVRKQAESMGADKHLRDILITTVGVNLATTPYLFWLLKQGYDSGDYLVMGISVYQFLPFVPKVNVAGVLRMGYMAYRFIEDRLVEEEKIKTSKELMILGLSITSPYGNMAAPLRMAAKFPELSKVIFENKLKMWSIGTTKGSVEPIKTPFGDPALPFRSQRYQRLEWDWGCI